MFAFVFLFLSVTQAVTRGETITIVYVNYFDPVTLTCPADDQATTLTWTGPGGYLYFTGTTMEADLHFHVEYRISASHTGGSYTLRLTEFWHRDTGIYTCTVDGTVNIQMVIVQDRSSVKVYTRLGWTVTLQSPHTGGSVYWTASPFDVPYTNRTQILSNIPDATRTRLKVTRRGGNWDLQISDVQLSDVREYKGYTRVSVFRSFYLLLSLKPGQPIISGQLSQTENNNQQLVCKSTGSRPAAMIQWNIGGTWHSNNPKEVKVKDSVTDTYTVTSRLSIPVTRQDNGKSVYCRASNQALSGGIESVPRSITVLYPPDIRVTYTNTTFTSPDRTFTCVPEGNPDTYQFGDWRHTSEDGTEIRQLTGSSSTTRSVLTLPDPGITRRYEDTGYYICKVSNEIPDSSSYSSSSVFFVVEAPPVVITNAYVVKGQIGDNVTMEVEFYSRPEVITSSITWTRGKNGLNPPDTSVTSINTRYIQTLFYGVDIKVEGYVAAIQIHHLVEEDFGNYTVTVGNSIGTITYTIWLKSASPPLPPKDFAPVNFDSSSITLQWTPNFNGGAEQVFVIGYKSDVSKDFVDLAPISDKHVKTQSYQITGLKPSSMHFIRMFAKNELGSSDFVFLNQSTAAVENPPTIGTLTWVIAGGSALSLIAIVVVSIVIYNIYKRRSKDFSKDSNQQSTYEDLNLANVSPPSVYEGIHERDFSNDSNQRSTYEDLNLANVSPPSVYEGIHERDYPKGYGTSSGNPYENVDRKPGPNVYENLPRIT